MAKRWLGQTLCLFMAGYLPHNSGVKPSVTLQDSLCCCLPMFMVSATHSHAHFGVASAVGIAIAPSVPLLLHSIFSLHRATCCVLAE